MIRVECPGCGSKLNAKDELAGQTRKCPKCGAAVHIAVPMLQPVDRAGPPATGPEAVEGALPRRAVPERLSRGNRYFICDRTDVVATWENNGHGWMVRGEASFVRAFRNADKLPSQGDFKLVELRMSADEERLRVRGLRVYQLAQRWALVQLARGDDAILKSVTGPAGLFREQKVAIREHIKGLFTHEVWDGAAAVREYLSNADFHSSEIAQS